MGDMHIKAVFMSTIISALAALGISVGTSYLSYKMTRDTLVTEKQLHYNGVKIDIAKQIMQSASARKYETEQIYYAVEGKAFDKFVLKIDRYRAAVVDWNRMKTFYDHSSRELFSDDIHAKVIDLHEVFRSYNASINMLPHSKEEWLSRDYRQNILNIADKSRLKELRSKTEVLIRDLTKHISTI